MSTVRNDALELIYEGSVKRVWQSQSKVDRLWFEFTDDYSIFDWGKMPDKIANKGKSLALMGAFLFDRLSRPEFWQIFPNSPTVRRFDPYWLSERFNHPTFSGPEGLRARGAASHFKLLIQAGEMVSDLRRAVTWEPPILMEVQRAQVDRPVPHKIGSNVVYFYPSPYANVQQRAIYQDRRFIPLEIVFRFGMPPGSSLPARLAKDPSYAKVLGLREMPEPATFFSHPVLEFYSKLEPSDRLLSLQEAALVSGLSPIEFDHMCEFALDVAMALFYIFQERDIELWDGKLELAIAGGRLLLVDSIGPDELRLIYGGCQLSKEMIRQIYRGSEWERAIKKAQAAVRFDPSRNWKDVCRGDMAANPEPLAPSLKATVDQLYGTVVNHVLNLKVFPDHPSLEEFARLVPAYLLSMPSSPPRRSF